MAEYDASLAAQVNRLVERTIARSVNGLEYIRGPAIPVGLTPKDVVLERGTLRLYHYRPQSDEVYRVPLLLVMATTNKAYIFDIAPGQSLVEYLCRRGFDVFVLDWEAPRPHERNLDLGDYTQDFIPSCIRTISRITGEPDVSIVGYCMGGVLSCIYAATHPNGPLKNLVCLTTPIDWHEMGLVRTWQDPRYYDVDRLVDTLGIIPADFVMQSFEMQRPAQRTASQIRLWEQMWNQDFVKSARAFERWEMKRCRLPVSMPARPPRSCCGKTSL
ncbi:MAG: alpha/beta fold hydrolase [Pseudomonadales bacterium]